MFNWLKGWTVDGLIIVSTIIATLGEISLNFITSYGHISILGGRYGEKGIDGALTPIIIDFALFAFAMLNLFLARKGRYVEVKKRGGRVKRKPEFRWPRWVLGGGVAATVAANVAYGYWWGLTGALIAAFAAVMLFFTIEGAMLLLRVAAEDRERKLAEKPAEDLSDLAMPDWDKLYRAGLITLNQHRAAMGITDPPPVYTGNEYWEWKQAHPEEAAAAEASEPAPVPGPSEAAEPAAEQEGKVQRPAINLEGWQGLNGAVR